MESMDSEKQKDEILALQSIYNHEEFSCIEENGFYHCTFKIHLSLPQGYYVTFRDLRSPDMMAQKVNVSYLPPLCLYVVLPQDYPSVSLPVFTLCTSWLQPNKMAWLCKKLDKLWEENKGQEILFTWIAFLQGETLESLKIMEHLNMDHAFTKYMISWEKAQSCPRNKDLDISSLSENLQSKLLKDSKMQESRAVLDCPAGTSPIQVLINYNDKQTQIEFKKNFHLCKICFTEKLGEHCTQFLPCGHIFCKDCITGYLEVRINDGNVLNITCPEEKCSSEATPGQIKDLVTTELFSKYDSFLLNIALNTMTDIIYCPRPHCQYPVTQEPNEEVANCPSCQYAFCIFCKSCYHGIEPCKITTAKDLVQEYKTASECKKIELERRYGKKQLQTLLQNTLSEDWINSNSRRCPNCKAAIEKSDGCNKMTCWKCNAFFCWMCNAELDRQCPYTHFDNAKSNCFMRLFGAVQPEDEYEEFGFEFPFYPALNENDDELDVLELML